MFRIVAEISEKIYILLIQDVPDQFDQYHDYFHSINYFSLFCIQLELNYCALIIMFKNIYCLYFKS